MDDFRADVRAWFAQHAPKGWREAARAMSPSEWVEFSRTWLRTLNTRGFGAPHVPREWGGGGYSLHEHVVILEEAVAADTPALDLFEISLFHVPGTLLTAGTPEQRERYIRAGIDGEIWCQGFSEPGAGSDLAGLSTRAVPEGDGWRIHGQKIWSSHAADARYCLLLARTDLAAPRHRGITYFILDLDQPGVDVRPIRQCSGFDEFCEIFLDGPYVGPDGVIGAPNEGWSVAQSTLETERSVIGLDVIERMGHQLRGAAATVAGGAGHSVAGQLTEDEAAAARLLARHEAVRALAAQGVDAIAHGDRSGGIASLLKVGFTTLLHDIWDWSMTLDRDAALEDPQVPHFNGFVSTAPQLDWLQSFAWIIAGGTNEIQRNIIAERLLGLPREPRPT